MDARELKPSLLAMEWIMAIEFFSEYHGDSSICWDATGHHLRWRRSRNNYAIALRYAIDGANEAYHLKATGNDLYQLLYQMTKNNQCKRKITCYGDKAYDRLHDVPECLRAAPALEPLTTQLAERNASASRKHAPRRIARTPNVSHRAKIHSYPTLTP